MNKIIIMILILAGILSGCSQRSLHSGSVYGSEEMGSPAYIKKGTHQILLIIDQSRYSNHSTK